MSIPNRELEITYGSYVVGGSTGIQFDGEMSTRTNYEGRRGFAEFEVTFSFVVTSTTEAGFKTACDSAETAFRKPFQDLTIRFGSQTHFSAKHSDGTGLEIKSEISKRSSELNTGRMRVFSVRVTGGLPADNAPTVGLREYGITLSAAPSGRKLLTLSGVFTATGATKSRAAYLAAIDALATSAISSAGAGGTYELVGRPREESSYNDLVLSFSRDYQEIIFSQAGSANDPQIVQQQLIITKHRRSERGATGSVASAALGKGSTSAPGAGGAQPLVEVEASWSASVDAAQTKDLRAVWLRVKPWVVQQMQSAFGSGVLAVIDERPSYQWDDNRITATVMGVGTDTGSSGVIRFEMEAVTSTHSGKAFVPVWGAGPYGYFVYDGPATRTVAIRTTIDQASGGGAGSVGGASSGMSLGVSRGGGSSGSQGSAGGSSGLGVGQIGGFGGWSNAFNEGGTPGGGTQNPSSGGTSSPAPGGGKGNGASENPTAFPSGGETPIPISRESTVASDVIGLDGKQIAITRTVTTEVVQFVNLVSAGKAPSGD